MQLQWAVIVVLLAAPVSAQPPPVDDRFYQAIRQDDLTALRALVRDEGVNAKDAQGQTPLMLAAAFGSSEAVRFLIAQRRRRRGGEQRRRDGASSGRPATSTKTRMLLDAGADVNAVSQLGRTPLIVAASANGTADVVRLLLAKGADVERRRRRRV